MKSMIFTTALLFFVNAYAGTPYTVLSCQSDDLKIKASAEGCTGELQFDEKGFDSKSMKKSCEDSEDKFALGYEFDDKYNQFYALADFGDGEVLAVGHIKELLREEVGGKLKVYRGIADVYSLPTDSSMRAYKDIECELKLFLQ